MATAMTVRGHATSAIPASDLIAAVPQLEPVERFLAVTRPTVLQEEPFPDWAAFMLRLGGAVATASRSSAPLFVAIAVPARPYAATLLAAGAVLARASLAESDDHVVHWDALRELVKRQGKVAVLYRSDTGAMSRTLVGFDLPSNPQYAILDAGGGVRSRVPAREALRIEPVGGEPKHRTHYARPKAFARDAGLASAVFPGAALRGFVSRSRLDCVIVGNESSLRDELLRETFVARAGSGETIEGHLNDIVRARSLAGDGLCYRSEITSPTSKDTRRKQTLAPALVIFDGSSAFLKWQRLCWAAHAVAILDRTDHRFDEATLRVDELAIESMPIGSEAKAFGTPPAGVEACVFEVSR